MNWKLLLSILLIGKCYFTLAFKGVGVKARIRIEKVRIIKFHYTTHAIKT